MSDQPEAKTGRIAQIRQAYRAIHQLDPRLPWWMAGAAVLAAAARCDRCSGMGRPHRFIAVAQSRPAR